MSVFFDSKGYMLSKINLFDREGFILQDIQEEIKNKNINDCHALSDLVKLSYTLKFWNIDTALTHRTIYLKL